MVEQEKKTPANSRSSLVEKELFPTQKYLQLLAGAGCVEGFLLTQFMNLL